MKIIYFKYVSTNCDKMKVYDAILSRRSIRRFKQKKIPLALLKKFVNGARLAPSAANLQPLEFFIVTDIEKCSEVFTTLSWAAYITPKWIPGEKERPVAYIINLIKDSKNTWYARDVSFATENIVLAAEEEGIGSCVLCKIDKEKIKEILKIPDEIIVDSVIALGYKAEKPVVERFTDSVKYWRDEKEVLHVPKRNLQDIIHINNF
jgi:nitroreductase